MADSLVIAEIGGSSSRWALLLADGNERLLPAGEGAAMPGLNPLNGDPERFIDALRIQFIENAPEFLNASLVKVYGAGCGSPERRAIMGRTLQHLWPHAVLDVRTDIMGAAIGLCQDRAGLVLILGTGMNSGYYDGQYLHHPMPSLGYLLGDEGSGADIGRVLLQDAFYRRMPNDVREALFGADGPDVTRVLEEIHRSPFPAKMLAARTALLVPLLDRPYVRDLIRGRFHVLADLLKTFFTQEQRAEVFATGSVAYGFRDVLAECLFDHGMSLVNVEKDPLHGLILHERRS